MTITYEITEETHSVLNIVRVSYGIAAYTNADLNGTVAIVASVKDITSDKQKLTEFVRKCNRLKLSLIHLYDAIEDFIID